LALARPLKKTTILTGTVVSFDEPFELDVYKWCEILDKIAKDRKNVSLDLSNATYKAGNTVGGLIEVTVDDGTPTLDDKYIAFDPFPALSSGKNYIVSITLPASAQIINQAVNDSDITDTIDASFIKDAKKFSAFRSFTKLNSVKADNVTLIGNFAFADCTALKEVNFPRVGHTVSPLEQSDYTNTIINGYRTDIGKYAFLGCTELKEVKFNSAAVIGSHAFKDCTSLEKIDFPEVWKIEGNAFEGCESLENIFFEKVSKIGKEAFKNCTDLKKAEFNVMPVQITFSDPRTGDLDKPCTYDSVVFFPSVFNGCKALEVLNVRRAWNVYFSKDVFANTGSAIDIYLFDENASTSYGHPQDAMFLGENTSVTIKKITIYVPVMGGEIQNSSDGLEAFIQTKYPTIDVNINKRTM